MKKSVAVVLSLVMIIICVLPMAGCNNSDSQIRNLMREFEYSCNSLDVDAMLDCVHPDITGKIKAAMGLVGMFTGQDSDAMLDAIFSKLTDNNQVDSKSFFSSVKLNVREVQSNDVEGTAKVDLSYKLGNEELVTTATFVCVKYDNKWYIYSFKL